MSSGPSFPSAFGSLVIADFAAVPRRCHQVTGFPSQTPPPLVLPPPSWGQKSRGAGGLSPHAHVYKRGPRKVRCGPASFAPTAPAHTRPPSQSQSMTGRFRLEPVVSAPSVHAQGGEYYAHMGLALCNAQLCKILHDAFQRRHKGIANKRDSGTANLLSFGSRRGTTFQAMEEFHRLAKHLQQWKHVPVHFGGQNCP